MGGSEQGASVGGQQSEGSLVEPQGAFREEETGPVGELIQRMRPCLEFGHGANEQVRISARYTQFRGDEAGEPAVIRLPDVMAVEILQLLEIEAGRRFSDMV